MQIIKPNIEEIQDLPTLQKKRDVLQQDIFLKCLKTTKTRNVVLALHPRLGKSYLTLKWVKALNNKYPDNLQLLIAPTTHIVKEFNKLFKQHNITNVVCTTLSGCFTKKFITKYSTTYWQAIYYDEADYAVSSSNSQKFYKVLNIKSNWKICLSGTFSKENLHILKNRQFDTLYSVGVEEGILMGTLPRFDTYNVSVELTVDEKQEYYQHYITCQKILMPYKQLFPEGNWADYAISVIDDSTKLITIQGNTKKSIEWLKDLKSLTGWQFGVFLGRKKQFNTLRIKMNDILSNSENKKITIKQILDNTNEKGIVFTSRKEICDNLQILYPQDVVAYHSDTDNDNILEDFKINNIKAIACVDKLTRGFTDTGISYAINSSYNSKRNAYIQKISRALSIDDNTLSKEVKIINLYCNNFKINGIEVLTKDYLRLTKSQEDDLVQWVTLDDFFNDL